MDYLQGCDNFIIPTMLYLCFLVSIVSVVFFAGFAFSSEIIISLECLNAFKSSLDRHLTPAVQLAIQNDRYLSPLRFVDQEIYLDFLDVSEGQTISVDVFKSIVKFFNDKLIDFKINESPRALISLLKKICYATKKSVEKRIRQISENEAALNIMADICHRFKLPVQWILFTSRAYGHPEMFQDTPILLEQIRKVFLSKTDPSLPIDFIEKLDFIKNTFSFHISQLEVKYAQSLIFMELKSQFFSQMEVISKDLLRSERPFSELATGEGTDSIEIEFQKSSSTTSNEDLWRYIMTQVETIRVDIEKVSLNLSTLIEFSVVDVIEEDLLCLCESSVPFSLIRAHKSIKRSVKDYLESGQTCLKDELNLEIVDKVQKEIEAISDVIKLALISFTADLDQKSEQVVSKFRINRHSCKNADWSHLVISEIVLGNI